MRGVLVTTADITAGGSVLASGSRATASVAATSTVTFDQYSLMVNGERAVAGHLQGGGDHVLAVLIRPMSHQEDGGENVLAIAVTGATACDLGTVRSPIWVPS